MHVSPRIYCHRDKQGGPLFMRLVLATALSLVVVSAATSESQAPAAPDIVAVAPQTPPRTHCSTDLLHPIEVEAHLVDGMAAGRWLRAVVRVQSRLDLASVQVDLDPAGAAEVSGPRKAAVAEIAAGRPYEYGFDVRVPDTAAPQQIRIRVSGLAEGARLERGAVLHLLPRGVTDPSVESAVLSGAQRVLEQRRAARREP